MLSLGWLRAVVAQLRALGRACNASTASQRRSTRLVRSPARSIARVSVSRTGSPVLGNNGRMSRGHAYPPDLARYVEAHWPSAALTVPPKLLDEALSAAFQASLTSEEARPTRFRLLLTPVEQLPEAGVPNQGVLRLKFDQSRPLNADELRRLAPAVPFETSLIGAHAEQEKATDLGYRSFRTGLARAHMGRAQPGPQLDLRPDHSRDRSRADRGPLRRQTGGRNRAGFAWSMRRWTCSTPTGFQRCSLASGKRFERSTTCFKPEPPSPTSVEHSLVGRVGQHMLRRAIQLVRGAAHGGMFLVVNAGVEGPSTDLDGLRLKYRFNQDEPSRRYRTLLFQILEAVAAATPKTSVGWSDFRVDSSPDLEKLEQAVFELSRVIANLAAIDGAVVLDKRFRLLGFGAEVSAELPTPQQVWRALDTEGRERAARSDRKCRHPPPSSLSLRQRSSRRPRGRHLPRRRRVIRRQSPARSGFLGAIREPVNHREASGLFLDERTPLELVEGYLQLLVGVHDDRTLPGNRFADRLP